MNESHESCGNCKFWDRETTFRGRAMCRRFPPTVYALNLNTTYQQPITYRGAWCGEWETDIAPVIPIRTKGDVA